MIKDEYETTYYSCRPANWRKTLNGLIDSFSGEKRSDRFYQSSNYIYFMIELGNEIEKEKIAFKLDDSHIVFRSSKKHLTPSNATDVQYYIEEKEKWCPLQDFNLNSIRNAAFYTYYKEKKIFECTKDCTNFRFVADNTYFIDLDNMRVVDNIMYIEVESDDLRVLESNQNLINAFMRENQDFQLINDSYSKYNLCRRNGLQRCGEIRSVFELENLLNRVFTLTYLHCLDFG